MLQASKKQSINESMAKIRTSKKQSLNEPIAKIRTVTDYWTRYCYSILSMSQNAEFIYKLKCKLIDKLKTPVIRCQFQ